MNVLKLIIFYLYLLNDSVSTSLDGLMCFIQFLNDHIVIVEVLIDHIFMGRQSFK